MDRNLKDTYRRFPISNSYGCGCLSFTLFCIDEVTGNQERNEILANSLHEAFIYSTQFYNSTASYIVLDDTSLQITFNRQLNITAYLFL